MNAAYHADAVSRLIWETKYRYRDKGQIHDQTMDDTWKRVAHSAASAEASSRQNWEARFLELLKQRRFLPGGRILAGAGTNRQTTLFNCFAMGPIEDSLEGILDALREGALTMQKGGGIGYDFSTLRPAGTPARRVGGIASGPVSFMTLWDSLCATLLSSGSRRGAMMATLDIGHPDIETFIDAKRQAGKLCNFNLSVLVSDAFITALEQNAPWPLRFSASSQEAGDIKHTVAARALWQRLTRAAYDSSEPGVLFIDRINRDNNLYYRETIHTTNPCGEIPLPPYGACNLGSINLTAFVLQPFTPHARWDLNGIAACAALALRLLDNVVDLSHYPLDKQRETELTSRRLGLGLTGLADALVMLELPYGEETARLAAAQAMEVIKHSAYAASIELAREKGAFPALEKGKYLASPFVRTLPEPLQQGIAKHGIRNSHLLAIAPAGSISLLAGNVSNGLEPIFAACYQRGIFTTAGRREFQLIPFSLQLWQNQGRGGMPPAMVTASQLSPEEHLAMQAILQQHVDNAISKTVQIPASYPYTRFRTLYEHAYRMGLKGCSTYRPDPLRGAVLRDGARPGAGCCGVED